MKNNIKDQLMPDERIIWEGKPDKKIFLYGPFKYLIFSIIFYIGFVVIWVINAIEAPIFFVVFGGLIGLTLLGGLIGRIFIAIKQYESLYYALTNKRAIIQQGVTKTEFQFVDLGKTYNIDMRIRSEEVGDIIFGSKTFFDFAILAWSLWKKFFALPPMFYGINNVQEVYKKIIELKNNLDSRFS